MTDFRLATQIAINTALTGAAAVTSRSSVYQHVPENTQPPLTIIGDLTTEGVGGKDGGLDRIEFEILAIVRQPSRKPLYELMEAQRNALEGVALVADGVLISPPEFLNSDDDLLDDGKTYMGMQRFAVFTQPAD